VDFTGLKSKEKSLYKIYPENGSGEFTSISTLDFPLENSIYFIKEKKLIPDLETYSNTSLLKNMGCIISAKLWSKFSEEESKEFCSKHSMVCTSENVDLAISYLSESFYHEYYDSLNHLVDGRQMGTVDIHPSAWIAQNVFLGENVTIGKDVKIYSGATIMGSNNIEEGSVIFPNVTLYPRVSLAENCRIHSSTVIGADGFGYNFDQGVHHKVWHFGGVKIGKNVEIGANSSIDGGTFSPTVIGDGSKIDNQVQLGHNCILGTGVVLCGGVSIGGSSIVGDYTVFGGRSGMGHGHKLGARCKIAGGCLVNCDWPDDSVLGGHPGRPLKEWMRGIAYLRKESIRK
jgi:UDP-3-O-[3-hydroxymyristoyl] glucosamine N-acyltransferase